MFKSNGHKSHVSAWMRQGLARGQYCEPRCQWNIDESVSNLGLLGGADISDLLGEMYCDRSYLWDGIILKDLQRKVKINKLAIYIHRNPTLAHRTDHRFSLS